jgi:choline-sulfatase
MTTPSPNLLIIMSDEHDPRYMGVSGDPLVRTPNLDMLAASGTRFTEAVTNSPICVPARAAFATGAYVHDIGYWDNALAYDGAVKGWGHALQEHDIRVDSIGKLHYRSEDDDAGFDAEHLPMHIYNGHGMVWGSVRDPLPSEQPRDGRMLGERIGAGESSYTRYDQSVTDLTLDWLDTAAQSNAEKPWCLFVGLVAPHFPLVVAQEFLSMYPLDALPPRKLHPRDGHPRHPWIQRHHDFWPTEDQFRSEQERLTAIAAYLGLTSWMDHNVGRIMQRLQRCGLATNTRVIYTSDHGDNVGHRGMWGKSNFYLESVAVPMIVSGPGVPVGVSATPVSLLDVHPTVLANFGLTAASEPLDPTVRRPGHSLIDLAKNTDDRERAVFSEYHAAGSPSGGFMLRKGRWKYHYYVGYPPELFDLDNDAQELTDLGDSAEHAEVRAMMHANLCEVCDPHAVDRAAKAAQAELIAQHGGRDKALFVGAPAATPVPGASAKFGD